MMTPVYNAFFRAAEDNGRTRRYSIDWKKLERALSGQRTSLMILRNPHNPIGRNWSADELTRILLLANEHQARVVADEIHGDLTLAPGEDYTPVLSLPRSLTVSVVMLMSPSKTFSEPGIQAALALAPDPLNAASLATGSPPRTSRPARPRVRRGNHRQPHAGSTVAPGDEGSTHGRTSGLLLSLGSRYRGNGADFPRMAVAYPRVQLDDALERPEERSRRFPRPVTDQSPAPPVSSFPLSPASSSSTSRVFGMSIGRQETSASQLPQRTA